MRALGILCTLALSLFLIVSSAAYAQERDENKPDQPQSDQKTKDNGKANENDKTKQEDKNAKPDERKPQEEPKAGRQEERPNQPEANRPEEQQQREQHPADNRREQEMGKEQNRPAADRGRHIPDDQFRSHFGREHRFHVQRNEIVNVSQPVVAYGGYSFQLAQPWPSEWSYDDDCYIDYVDDQYYLFDAMHPGVRILVFVIG
jgi:hypothetical protein